ncbi:MAG: glycosyltransferase family 2 protein [Dehalococcoidia bacterium]|nr:glycosyltransferase family 2 protein [Dehalococcoidia bacterium]
MTTPSMTHSHSETQPLVAAITVNWNGLSDTRECLDSLKNQTYQNLIVVVVDNASDGDDAERISEAYGDFVTVVRTNTNLGCAGGYNTGIRHVSTLMNPDYFIVINNDVTADQNMVKTLVETAALHPAAGVIGPKIFYKDYHGRSDVIWSAGGTINRWALKIHRQLGDGIVDCADFNNEREVDWVSGAAMLFTPEVLHDAGYFNTWYFIGHEDIEFCLKATATGHMVTYAPRARAWHEVGASARKLSITYTDPGAYFYLIRQTFPRYVYMYHLALFPLLLARWTVLYIARSRDRNALRRFLRDLRRFLSGSRRNTTRPPDAVADSAEGLLDAGPASPG